MLPDPWESLTLQEKQQVMQFLEDAAKVKEKFTPPARVEALTEIIKKHCAFRDGFNYTFSTIGIMLAAKEIYDLK